MYRLVVFKIYTRYIYVYVCILIITRLKNINLSVQDVFVTDLTEQCQLYDEELRFKVI